ncbi:hypothetical protein SGLAM104S_01297 [Streptomyces glaucescens]
MDRARAAGQLRSDVGVGDVMVAVAQLADGRYGVPARRPVRPPSSATVPGRAAGSGPLGPAGSGRDHGGSAPALRLASSAHHLSPAPSPPLLPADTLSSPSPSSSVLLRTVSLLQRRSRGAVRSVISFKSSIRFSVTTSRSGYSHVRNRRQGTRRPRRRSLESARLHRARPVDGRPRLDHREHRPALRPAGPRHLRRQPAVGRHGLRPRLRWSAAVRRPDSRPVGPQARFRRRPGRLRARLRAGRRGHQRGHDVRRPCPAGRVRCHARARRAVPAAR